MLDTQGVPFGSLKAFIYKYGKYELLKKKISKFDYFQSSLIWSILKLSSQNSFSPIQYIHFFRKASKALWVHKGSDNYGTSKIGKIK